MNVSLRHRAVVSRAQLRLPLNRQISVPFYHQAHGKRNLWWWSRRATEWTDDELEERMQRHQKMMRYRYSKALRRRAIWETEDQPACGWPFSRRLASFRWASHKGLSSGRALDASLQDRGKRPDQEQPWKEWDRDFEKLKARIDDAVDRDPYGALFGRHLRSPLTTNNSSWTSFSWIYGPLRSVTTQTKESAKTEQKVVGIEENSTGRPPSHTSFSVPPIPPRATETAHTGRVEEAYEFDPISMRKVPKQKEALVTSAAPRKPFLLSLFSEHGVEIPVKTYKPHKVYGHGGPSTAPTKPDKLEKPKPPSKIFESSRQRELQALKAVTLGTNIDTTAEYWGKYSNEPGTDSVSASNTTRGARNVETEASDNAPLFSGTTYEARLKHVASNGVPKTDWLLKEGFQNLPEAMGKAIGAKIPSLSQTVPEFISRSSKIQPSLDRVKATDVKTSNLKKIQPSLDRIKASDIKTRTTLEHSNLKKLNFADKGSEAESSEDIDLLRASDVRAATRTARKTVQELQQERIRAREVLEADYNETQIQSDTLGTTRIKTGSAAKNVLQRSLSNVWKHIKEYPEGIVAKTINSMGIFNDNYKSYVRLDKPLTDSTQKLVFQDQSLSKTPSIYKKIAKGPVRSTFTPSQEVIDAEKAHKARLEVARQANERLQEEAALESKRAEGLAVEIRNAYEAEYGPINVDHRQPQTIPSRLPTIAVSKESDDPKILHSMQAASIKPGVPRDFAIESHVSKFEPHLAKLVDEAKSTRKAIHEAKLAVNAMRSQRPPTYWNARSLEESPTASTLDQEPAPTVKMDARTIVVPAIEPSDSPSKNNKITPPLLTSDAAPIPDTSKTPAAYMVLAYDPSNNRVQVSPMNSSMFSATVDSSKVNVLQILAKLTHPAKFMPHFEDMANQGYEIASGSGDVIVFKRLKKAVDEPRQAQSAFDENRIAVDETAAQPSQQVIPPKNAATVLDELPTSGPTPGPSAPTAPPSISSTLGKPKVRRQEDVFSASKTSRVSRADDASAKTKQEEPMAEERTESFWKRFKRGVRRVVFTAAAMGGGAYAIGVVAESVGAQQPQVVHTGRPGIYSTENSR